MNVMIGLLPISNPEATKFLLVVYFPTVVFVDFIETGQELRVDLFGACIETLTTLQKSENIKHKKLDLKYTLTNIFC